ncbi:putative membrane protein [Actinopolyspora lacussalsi]|nr:putative membrane protein [Actinopolyspora lacussalsi]
MPSPEDSASGITNAPPTGHGHGHGHGHPAPTASRRTRRLLAAVLTPFALAAVIGAVLLYPFGQHSAPEAKPGFTRNPVDGAVVAARTASCTTGGTSGQGAGGAGSCVLLRVELHSGPASGRTIEQRVPDEPTTPEFGVGDEIVLSYSGDSPRESTSYRIVDYQRSGWLLVLVGLFAASVIALGRRKGAASLLALTLTLTMLLGFMLPTILSGADPLLVAVVAAGLIMFCVLYATHGVSARTSTAVLGTLASLSLIGLLSAGFAALTRLTGLDESTSSLISALGHDIDARGLLLAGVVIGALGVLDDVTVTQTSAVWELHHANPRMRWRELYSAALRIGRDHVASSVNTLVLAYAGTALPLLLTYKLSGQSFGDIATTQDVAQEIVRTLVGSLGLIAAVPLTTAIAATVVLSENGSRRVDDSATHSEEQRAATSGVLDVVHRAAAAGSTRAVLGAARSRRGSRSRH